MGADPIVKKRRDWTAYDAIHLVVLYPQRGFVVGGFYETTFFVPVEATNGIDISYLLLARTNQYLGRNLPVCKFGGVDYISFTRKTTPTIATKLDAMAVATVEAMVLYVGVGLPNGMI